MESTHVELGGLTRRGIDTMTEGERDALVGRAFAYHRALGCSSCGHTDKANRTTQAEFKCLNCGFTLNADLNAAKNILEAASLTDSLNACGGDVRPR
jgi:hypothetical protein